MNIQNKYENLMQHADFAIQVWNPNSIMISGITIICIIVSWTLTTMTFTVDEDVSCSLQHLLLTLSPNQHLLSQAFPPTVRYPYHTSVLTGEGWVLELLAGHPQRIQTELGVSHHVFQQLTTTLRSLGLDDSPHVKLDEQLAIFLYASVTGLSVRHLGERFQHSNGTISL
jgi:hypothetical protein